MQSAYLALLFFAPPQTGAWPEVIALAPGTEIRMKLEAGTFGGTFVSATDGGITVRVGREEHAIIESSIRRIDRRVSGSNRARNIGRGVGIGVGVGLLRIGLSGGGTGIFATPLWGPSILVGTLMGSTWPAARWETVFERR